MKRKHKIYFTILIFIFISFSTYNFVYFRSNHGLNLAKEYYNYNQAYEILERLLDQIPKNQFEFTQDELIKILNLDSSAVFISGTDQSFVFRNISFTFDDDGILKDIKPLPEKLDQERYDEYFVNEKNKIYNNDHKSNLLLMERMLIEDFVRGGNIMWFSNILLLYFIIIIIQYLLIEFKSKNYIRFNSIINQIYVLLISCFILLFWAFYNLKLVTERIVQYHRYIDPIISHAGFDYQLIFPTFLINLFLIGLIIILYLKIRIKNKKNGA